MEVTIKEVNLHLMEEGKIKANRNPTTYALVTLVDSNHYTLELCCQLNNRSYFSKKNITWEREKNLLQVSVAQLLCISRVAFHRFWEITTRIIFSSHNIGKCWYFARPSSDHLLALWKRSFYYRVQLRHLSFESAQTRGCRNFTMTSVAGAAFF